MAHTYLEILKTEISEHLCRVRESRRDFAETIAVTLKSIDESRALMAEVDAIIAKRRQPIAPSNKRVDGRLVRLTDGEEIAQARGRMAQVIHLPLPARAVPPAATAVDGNQERRRIRRVDGRLMRLTDREKIAQAKDRIAQVIHLPLPTRAVPPAATAIDLKKERHRIRREARLQRAIDEAWRQAKKKTPDADFSALFCAARARLSTHDEFGPDFQEAQHHDREQ